MPFKQVTPVYDAKVRALCVRPYPLHPKGCPNFGKKPGCPPQAPQLPKMYDLAGPCFVIWNVFDFGAHVAKMKTLHPGWSERQLTCCLYWQGTARKQLEAEIDHFRDAHSGLFIVERCPEAMGLNVTETLRAAEIKIEWPPATRAVQVAFAALPPAELLDLL